jgi:hypothetical protein
MELIQNIQQLNEAMQSFDWKHAFYDPMDVFNFELPEDEIYFSKLEKIVNGLKKLSSLSEDGSKAALILMKHHWKGHPMEAQIKNINDIKITTMNAENFEYLKEQLKYHGFGESLNESLAAQLSKGEEKFSLLHQIKYEEQTLTALLDFKRSGERVYFNRYHARIPDEAVNRGQSFYINNGRGVTLKEAFNLLEGRAVYKELTNKQDEKYKAWIQLDMNTEDRNKHKVRHFTEAYGFEPVKHLQDLQLSANSLRTFEQIQHSLEKGNRQAVECETNGKKIIIYAEATPQYKTVRLFDKDDIELTKEQKSNLLKPENELKVAQNIKIKKEFPDMSDGETKQVKKNEMKMKVK